MGLFNPHSHSFYWKVFKKVTRQVFSQGFNSMEGGCSHFGTHRLGCRRIIDGVSDVVAAAGLMQITDQRQVDQNFLWVVSFRMLYTQNASRN